MQHRTPAEKVGINGRSARVDSSQLLSVIKRKEKKLVMHHGRINERDASWMLIYPSNGSEQAMLGPPFLLVAPFAPLLA